MSMYDENPEETVRLAETGRDEDYVPRSECCGDDPEMNWSVVILTYETEQRDNVLVQQRSELKDRKPGYHEITAGHVKESDGSLEQAAVREYAEELYGTIPENIEFDSSELEYVDTVAKRSKDNPEMLEIYEVVHEDIPEDGYAQDLSDEVDSAWFEPVEKVLERKHNGRQSKFTDSASKVLETVKKNL